MFTLIDLLALFTLLCSGLGAVDARTIPVVRAPSVVGGGDVVERSAVEERDVISPPITYPTSGTVWDAGSRQTITWDTSVIPPGTTSNGMLVLGYLEPPDDLNEHLDLDNPLAKDFPITAGHADITVPTVTTRNTYIVVLFGDSGNASNKFTIKNLSIGGGSSSSSGTAAPAPTPASTAASGSGDSASPPSATGASPDAGPAPAPAPAPEVAVPSSPAAAAAASAAAPTSTSPASKSPAQASQATPAAAQASSAAYRLAPLDGSAVAVWTLASCVLGVVLGAEI